MNSWISEMASFAWAKAPWAGAAGRVPALLVCVGVALAWHQAAAGVVAAGACLPVGLAGYRKIAGSSVRTMAATTVVLTLSAAVGTLVGASWWLYPVAVTVWALIFSFLTIHDDNLGWVAMQAVIALVIAGGFPGQGEAALVRAAVVLAGGATQTVLVALFAAARERWWPESVVNPAGAPRPFDWTAFSDSFALSSKTGSYALRLTLTLLVAVELSRRLPIQNSYWLPMTTIIVLKPDFYRTYSGAAQRVAGTFLGVGIASLIAHLLHPAVAWLVLLTAVFSFGCFAFIQVNTTLFAAALTAYVVFLVAITGLPETTLTGHRLIHTLLGSSLALGSRLIGLFFRLRLPFRRSA